MTERPTGYIVCERNGMDCFTPYERNDDGTINIVYGLALLGFDMEEMKKRADKIVRVDDEYELTNPRVEWERELANPTPDHAVGDEE